jgi:hypothetical protein
VLKTNHNPTLFEFLARWSGRRNPNDREGRSRAIREWLGVAIAFVKLIFDLWASH